MFSDIKISPGCINVAKLLNLSEDDIIEVTFDASSRMTLADREHHDPQIFQQQVSQYQIPQQPQQPQQPIQKQDTTTTDKMKNTLNEPIQEFGALSPNDTIKRRDS